MSRSLLQQRNINLCTPPCGTIDSVWNRWATNIPGDIEAVAITGVGYSDIATLSVASTDEQPLGGRVTIKGNFTLAAAAAPGSFTFRATIDGTDVDSVLVVSDASTTNVEFEIIIDDLGDGTSQVSRLILWTYGSVTGIVTPEISGTSFPLPAASVPAYDIVFSATSTQDTTITMNSLTAESISPAA